MPQPLLPAYARQHLPTELRLMQTGGYARAHPTLSAEEKALIYHYTASGSTAINRLLRLSQGVPANPLSEELVLAVQKMPCHEGNAFSAAHLSPAELSRLRLVFTGGTPQTAQRITWPAFLSASRSILIAERHLNYTGPPLPHNCLFQISSLRGRSIELLSHYGPNSHDPYDNEQEILFLPNTTFRIIGINFANTWPQVELLEL
ncbi:hypothetical protein [Hymenobacter sp. PAMC 26628]|uniref:hypothetical protein n=1 Tax=Hymenobacter sp. PAMC 26628 TaxID=1484118 RepID=UPI0007701E41|nr:hypothetical protein [Hymenobacter sp. PAMC 26628]AMJ66236.1 hypothetical protein AXW84_12915 [Hymenobacter sp. PAMC 26628]